MSWLKKAGIFFWTILPYMVLANINGIETDAIDKAYANKECQYKAVAYREKDYQSRYDEGYEEGIKEGYGRAKIVAFNIIMEILAEIKEKDTEPEEQIKTAEYRLSSLDHRL